MNEIFDDEEEEVEEIEATKLKKTLNQKLELLKCMLPLDQENMQEMLQNIPEEMVIVMTQLITRYFKTTECITTENNDFCYFRL